MCVVEYINFASNLTHCATITTIDTWLSSENALTNNTLFKRLKLVLNIVCCWTIFCCELLNNCIANLTNTLVARGFFGDAIGFT